MSSKEKIIFIVNDISISGGLERVTCTLGNEFLKNKKEVEIISLFGQNNEIPFEINSKITFLSTESYIKNRYFRGLNKLKKYIKVYYQLKKEKDVVIIGTDYYINFLVSLLNKKNIKKIGMEHVIYESSTEFWRKVKKLFYKNLDKLIVVNNTDKKKYSTYLKNVECIPNPNFYSCQSYENKFEKNRQKNILAIGRLVKDKGFLEMIELFEKIKNKFPLWTLSIYGEGDLKEELLEKIKEYNLENRVFLKGVKKDLSEEYMKSSILISMSKLESFSLTLIEAQSFGLPVISYDCPYGPKEIIEQNKNGYLIELNNLEKYEYYLCKLMSDRKLREDMGKIGEQKALNYSIKNIIGKWERI